MSRTPRPIIPGAAYFVSSVTYERRPWFATPAIAQLVIDQWRHYANEYQFRPGCVLRHARALPCRSHTHGHQDRVTGTACGYSYIVTLIAQHLGVTRKPKVWQGDPWDEAIRDENMYWQKVAYTLLNPWRKGLVDNPLDPYPYSSLGELLARESEGFVLDLFSRYKRWHE